MNFPTDKLTTNFFATLNARVSQLRKAQADVIRLDIGSPDLPPADHIITALSLSAAHPDSHGYQPHQGSDSLREAWATMYQRQHQVDLNRETQVLPLLGSKEGVFHLSQALLNPGDIVLRPDPGYQTYKQSILFAGAEPFTLPLYPENHFLPDLDAIVPAIARKAKILWLNYPNNPTAAVAPLDFFAEAVEFCRHNDILLCHDAAYIQVTFDGYKAPSILEVPGAIEVAVEFNTLSKSHNMAGWRSGVAVGQSQAIENLLKIKSHADSGHFLPIIEASQVAMTADQSWLGERNAVYQARRDAVMKPLRELGLETQIPKASLYVWCRIPNGIHSDQFVIELLEGAHVSLTPGSIFGEQGRDFVRILLTQPLERIQEAMKRIKNWVEK